MCGRHIAGISAVVFEININWAKLYSSLLFFLGFYGNLLGGGLRKRNVKIEQ